MFHELDSAWQKISQKFSPSSTLSTNTKWHLKNKKIVKEIGIKTAFSLKYLIEYSAHHTSTVRAP